MFVAQELARQLRLVVESLLALALAEESYRRVLAGAVGRLVQERCVVARLALVCRMLAPLMALLLGRHLKHRERCGQRLRYQLVT